MNRFPRSSLVRRATGCLRAYGALLAGAMLVFGQTGETSPENALRPVAGREALLFRNGDRLYGALQSLAPTTGVRWQHSDAEQVIDFLPDNVAEIHFPSRPRPLPAGTASCRVQLNNQDELEGSSIRLDSENALLQTWYAGEITIPRRSILVIKPVPPEGATLFQGPTGLEGWTIGKVVSALGDAGEWKYRNGAFYATNAASIARDLKMPDEALIEFDLAWKGVFQLAIALFTDYLQPINLANKDTEPDFAGFYSLQLNSFSANLLPVKKNDPLRYLGQISVPAFNQRNAAHVEIRASKSKRSVSLLVDGQLIKQWVDTEEFAGQGKGMRFVHQGQGRLKLSHLKVSEWNGQMEDSPAVATDARQDVVRLRNGDKVEGHVKLVDTNNVQVSNAGTDLDIPLVRVKRIELAGSRPDAIGKTSETARAIFCRGGAVTFELERWEPGKVLGQSPNFGKLTFDPAAFSKVELRLKSRAE